VLTVANGDTLPSRLGDINSGSATQDLITNRDLFLKVFSGEVLTWFNEATVMMGRHRVKTIPSGKSAQFPAIGSATAAYHIVGDNILDSGNGYVQEILANEVVINIDEKLTSSVFVSDIDEVMNHYDTRSEYAMQLGHALAKWTDIRLLRLGVLAARTATATITGGPVGGNVTNASVATDMDVFADACYEAAEILDSKDIPSEGRYVVVPPAIYWRLVRMGGTVYTANSPVELIDSAMSPGNGSVAGGVIRRIAGLEIVMSNLLPTGNESAVTGEHNDYTGDFTVTEALVFQQQAIGTVKLLDLSFESEYQITHQGTLMVASQAMGHKVLRPECAVELRSAAPA
jgi:hypothetical protein